MARERGYQFDSSMQYDGRKCYIGYTRESDHSSDDDAKEWEKEKTSLEEHFIFSMHLTMKNMIIFYQEKLILFVFHRNYLKFAKTFPIREGSSTRNFRSRKFIHYNKKKCCECLSSRKFLRLNCTPPCINLPCHASSPFLCVHYL